LATYSANIKVNVTGLTSLKGLEDRVALLRQNFTKINAAASNISAPFQNHIKALEQMNRLLVANGRLLDQQANAADRLSRTSGGKGRNGATTDSRVLEEQRRGWQQQLDLLKQRARALQENTEIMSKLLRAEGELTATSNTNLRLGKELLKNAKALLIAEEAIAKRKAAAEAEQVKTQMWVWQQQQKINEERLRAQEHYYSERNRLAAQASRDEEREAAEKQARMQRRISTAGKVGNSLLDAVTFGNGAAAAKGVANSAIRGGLAAATVGAGAMQVGADSVLRSIPGGEMLANIGGALGQGVAAMTGPLGIVGTAIHDLLSTLGHLPQSLQLATIAAFAFAPAVGGIAAQVVKGLPAIGDLGKALLNLTGISERAQPVLNSLKKTLNTAISDNAFTSGLYGLGKNEMKLPPNAGAFYERGGGTAFGNNLNTALLPKIYDGILKNIQVEYDRRMKVVSAEQSWIALLKEGAEIQKEIAKQANIEAAANQIGGKRFAIRSTNIRTQFNSGTAEQNAASIADMRARSATQIGNPNTYAKEALPGGNSLAAQSQYRQLLNDSARLQQAITSAVDREGKGRLALNAAATYGVANAERRLKLQNDVNASEQRSVQILRERNAILLEGYKAEQRVAAGQLDRASRLASLRNQKAKGEALATRTESVALGVGFPLLFGGGTGSVLGSLAGSFVGSGFGGQILGGAIGQAIDELVTKSGELRKSLSDLNAGLPQVGAGMRTTAEDVKYLSQRLGLANEETVKLLESFRVFDSGNLRKTLAEAFGGVGGFQSVDALASIVDEKTAVEAIAKLRDEVGLSVARQALDQLKINGAAGALVVLEDKLLSKQNEKNIAKAKEVTLWDRILAAAISSTTNEFYDPAKFGEDRVKNLKKADKDKADAAIAALREYYKEFDKLQKEFSDKTVNGNKKTAEQQAAEQARLNEQRLRDQIEIDNAIWNHRRQLLDQERALRRQIAEEEGKLYGLQQTGGGKNGAEIINQLATIQRDYQDAVQKLTGAQADAMQKMSSALLGVTATAAGPAPVGSRFKPTQYITGDPNSPNYRSDHAGGNYHDHLSFATREEAKSAYQALRAAGIIVTELKGMGAGVTGAHSGPGSAHHSGLAFDVPGYQWGGTGAIGSREYAGSAKVRSIIGMGNSRIAKSEGKVGVAATDIEAANAALRDQIPLLEKLMIVKGEAVIAGITSAYADQAKSLNDATSNLQLRSRLEMEGVRPEIIDGELKKADLYRKSREELQVLSNALTALGPRTEENAFSFDKLTAAIKATETGSNAAAAAIDASTQALIRQQFAQQQSDLQGQLGAVGKGFKAGFIGNAASTFESTLAKGGSVDDATRLADLTRQIDLAKLSSDAFNQSITGIGDAFATSMANGIGSLTTGAASAKQIFANMLNAMASALISAGTRMIATYIAIGLAKMFAGMSGGGHATSLEGVNMADVTKYASAPPIPFAEGGVMTSMGAMPLRRYSQGGIANRPQMAMYGEGSQPEAFVPLPDGRRIPVNLDGGDRMRQMMGRSPAEATTPVLNMSFQTTNIGGVEYVSRDQLEQAMHETRRQATKDGAKRGMSMTLDKLQQSPSTRSRVGMR
jgi:hypothetical protein